MSSLITQYHYTDVAGSEGGCCWQADYTNVTRAVVYLDKRGELTDTDFNQFVLKL